MMRGIGRMRVNHRNAKPCDRPANVECRPPRADELDAMLGLICDAFGLPFGPARDLFYKDPYFDVERKRVLVAGGQVVSCLTIVEADLWIGQSIVRVGGIAGVATAAEHRNRGYATRLLLDVVPTLRESGCVFSALFPYAPLFYRKLGWETVGSQYEAVVPRSQLPTFAEARYVRPALPADNADIARVYDATTLHRSGSWIRDASRWDYMARHVKTRVVYKRGDVGGYAFYEICDTSDSTRRLRLLEMESITEEARRGLVGFLAGLEGVEEIAWTARLEDIAASGVLPEATQAAPDGKAVISAHLGPMFRIVDFASAIRSLTANLGGFRGEVVLHANDEHAHKGDTMAVAVGGDGQSLRFNTSPTAHGGRNRIEGDIRAWAQVLTGYYSLDDALSLNRLRALSPSAAASLGPSFPRRCPFIPPADHF